MLLSYFRFQQLTNLITETNIIVRIYIVQGINLRPQDASDNSDSYVQIEYGNSKVIQIIIYVFLFKKFVINKKITDRAHYIPNQTNPIFGKRFQFTGVLPR